MLAYQIPPSLLSPHLALSVDEFLEKKQGSRALFSKMNSSRFSKALPLLIKRKRQSLSFWAKGSEEGLSLFLWENHNKNQNKKSTPYYTKTNYSLV